MAFFAEEDAKKLLRNWERLNEELLSLPIEGVQELLQYAVKLKRGKILLHRIYMRYSRLRRKIEVKDLLETGHLPWHQRRPRSTSKLKPLDPDLLTHLLR